ncbi:hypothetical protein BC830DRAFT_1131130 [Chytriomyces sp. MP71]|nr:hypothetical protein BC830DRAFT_1131130 [Chytriomyces sp. MP71]
MPNPNYQSHQNHPRKERISSKKHSDSDTDSDNFVPSDDSEAIDPLPSKAQVRRSILSVVNRLSILSASAHEVPLPGDNTSSFLLGAVATTPVSPVSISSISLNQNHPAHAPRNSSASSPGGTLSRSTNMNLLSPISVSSQEYFNPFASVSAPERSHSLTNTHPSPKMESTSDVESPTTTLNLSMRRERNGSHDSKITTPSETSTQEFNLATHAVNVAINNNYHQNNVFVIPKRDQSTRLSAAILSDSSVFTASSSFESDVHATVASSVTVIRPARSTSEGASMSETVILEGFLVKKMNVFAREKEHIADSGTWGWKPRYFKLKEVSLEEYDSVSLTRERCF